MSTINDGGPAFPRPMVAAAPGMTLRDWFASQALAGLLAFQGHHMDAALGAEDCYNYADAMLKAREVKP
jgi:hypothetical protein